MVYLGVLFLRGGMRVILIVCEVRSKFIMFLWFRLMEVIL